MATGLPLLVMMIRSPLATREEMSEVRLRLERAYARHNPSDKLAHKTRLPHSRAGFATRAGLVQWSEVTGLLTSRTRRSSIAHRPDAESRDSRLSREEGKRDVTDIDSFREVGA